MRYSALATVLIGLSALLASSCATTRRTAEVSGSRFQVSGFQEARDSLHEEILQNLNENLEEHEVVTWTFVHRTASDSTATPDTVKVERVTHRERVRSTEDVRSKTEERVKTLTVRDTVYIERRDSVYIENTNLTNSTNGDRGSVAAMRLKTLKWIFFIIIGLIGLIVTAKVCLRK